MNDLFAVEQERFERAKIAVLLKQNSQHGFGTLKEKTVHQIMKLYYAPNEDYHEVPVNGYIADIYTGKEIIEIQNGNFNKMRDKLKAFLPEYDVTIVYPIPHNRWLLWLDEESGEISSKRKSPRIGSGYTAFSELYKIKSFLNDPHLHFRFPLLDMEEYRLLNGWSKDKKRGSSRYDRVPIAFYDEVIIDSVRDYLQFIPYDLNENFTNIEFAKKAHIHKDDSATVLLILYSLGILNRVGKKGNAFIYSIAEEYK